MKKPRFELKQPNAKEETLLVMVIRLNGQRTKISTGKFIHPDNWNQKEQQMRERRGLPYKDFNKVLKNYTDKVTEIILEIEAEGKTPTVNMVKTRFQDTKELLKKDFEKVSDYLTHFQNEFKKRGAKGGERFFKTAADKLNEFNPNLQWIDLNETTFRKFKAYLEKPKGKEKKVLSANYIGTILNRLRIMFNDAHRNGYLRHTDFKAWRRTASEDEAVPTVYLTEKEIQTLYDKELDGHLEKARDLFIVGCCTGMRVGNYLNLDPKIQVQDGFIHAIVNKNGPKVMIPLHWMVKEILEKYDGFPKSISEQKLNEYIKKACEKAEINKPFQWHRTEGGKRVIHTSLKWELVTSHTARRSFATNLYLRGENPKTIMNITGHSTIRTFYKYIKVTSEESSRKLAQSDFFKK